MLTYYLKDLYLWNFIKKQGDFKEHLYICQVDHENKTHFAYITKIELFEHGACHSCPTCRKLCSSKKVLTVHQKTCKTGQEILYNNPKKVFKQDSVTKKWVNVTDPDDPVWFEPYKETQKLINTFGLKPFYIVFDCESMRKQLDALYVQDTLSICSVTNQKDENGEYIYRYIRRKLGEPIKKFWHRFIEGLYELHHILYRKYFHDSKFRKWQTMILDWNSKIREKRKEMKALREQKKDTYITKKEGKTYINSLEHKINILARWMIQLPVQGFNNARYDNKLFRGCWGELVKMPNYVYTLGSWLLKDGDISEINMAMRIARMIKNYKQQDVRKMRPLTKDYIDYKTIRGLIQIQEKKCIYCKHEMSLEHRNQANGLTCDRIDNNIAHTRTNCVLACKMCNCSKKNEKLSPKSKRKILELLSETLMSVNDKGQVSFYDKDFMKKIGNYLEDIKPDYPRCVKAGTTIRKITSACFCIGDLIDYTGPCNLEGLFKAWGITDGKLALPYEWMDDLKKIISYKGLPPHDYWYSRLKMSNIPLKTYKRMCKIFEERGFTKFDQFLKLYNYQDTKPMIELIDKMRNHFYKRAKIDMFSHFSITQISFRTNMKAGLFDLFRPADKSHHKELRELGLQGGLSVVSYPYHERNVTKIKGKNYCKKIIGYDASALYLWATSQNLPTGQYIIHCKNPTTKNHILLNPKMILKYLKDSTIQFNGFVKCDIKCTPELEKKWKKFGMFPFIKSCTFTPTTETHGELYDPTDRRKRKKLMDSLFVKGALVYVPFLRRYVETGHIVENIEYVIEWGDGRPFKGMVKEITDARRLGDIKVLNKNGKWEKPFKLIADQEKLKGNVFYGNAAQNKFKHAKNLFVPTEEARRLCQEPFFKDAENVGNGIQLVTMVKQRLRMDMPLQLSCAVYQLAKLKMFDFYWFLIHTLDSDKYQTMHSDTDSIYIALSEDNIEDCVINHKLWNEDFSKYFPNKSDDYKCTISRELNGKTYSQKLSYNEYDQRTPGLFKVEGEGTYLIEETSKFYLLGSQAPITTNAVYNSFRGLIKEFTGADKMSMKGANKRLYIKTRGTAEKIRQEFLDLLYNKNKLYIEAENRGFKSYGNFVIYYEQKKKVCSKNRYDKRKISFNKEDGSFNYEWTGL